MERRRWRRRRNHVVKGRAPGDGARWRCARRGGPGGGSGALGLRLGVLGRAPLRREGRPPRRRQVTAAIAAASTVAAAAAQTNSTASSSSSFSSAAANTTAATSRSLLPQEMARGEVRLLRAPGEHQVHHHQPRRRRGCRRRRGARGEAEAHALLEGLGPAQRRALGVPAEPRPKAPVLKTPRHLV